MIYQVQHLVEMKQMVSTSNSGLKSFYHTFQHNFKLQKLWWFNNLDVLPNHSNGYMCIGTEPEPAWEGDSPMKLSLKCLAEDWRSLRKITDARNSHECLNNRTGAGVAPYYSAISVWNLKAYATYIKFWRPNSPQTLKSVLSGFYCILRFTFTQKSFESRVDRCLVLRT